MRWAITEYIIFVIGCKVPLKIFRSLLKALSNNERFEEIVELLTIYLKKI